MRKRPLSIRARFLIVSFVSVPSALALAAAFLISLFAANLGDRFQAELAGHVNDIAAAIRFEPDGRIRQPAITADRRFAKAYDGLYWQIEDATDDRELRSRSLWDFTLVLPQGLPEDRNWHSYDLAGPNGTRLLAYERAVMIASPSGARTLRIVAAADRGPLDAASHLFALRILPYLAGLAAFLILASLVQLTLGLRPLSKLTAGLDRIREHRGERLDGVLPKEFQPVEDALNRLLDAQGFALAKARAHAGDLAHGLKTPLTILSNDALTLEDKGEREIAAEIEGLVALMRTHVEHELVRSRIAFSAEMRQSDGDLVAAVGQVTRTLKRDPNCEELDWRIDMPEAVVLPVDPHDLRELAGNLLENAAKWSARAVSVRWQGGAGHGALVIEDDGPGIDPERIEKMTERGIRYDQRIPGSGFGLSIVREICDVYGLTLTIENRQSHGLRVAVTF